MSWTSPARGWISATCALALAGALGCTSGGHRLLDIATTTSVQNSGLLDALLPSYREQAGVEVRVHAAGSGRALQMMSEELVQLVVSHAPDAEARALQEHPDWVQYPLAFNHFLVVGPPSDPAGVRLAADAADAFRRIAGSTASFVSRGDMSGTHERENTMWGVAGVRRPPARLIISGRGMALALRHADEVQGYTLTDEATYRQFEGEIDLVVLYAGDDRLVNRYSVIYPRQDEAAARFARWLVKGEGRDRIGAFAIRGTPVFRVPPDLPR